VGLEILKLKMGSQMGVWPLPRATGATKMLQHGYRPTRLCKTRPTVCRMTISNENWKH